MECEFPGENATTEEIKEILKNNKTIAIVGLSADEEKDSYRVAKYMKQHGYKIIPVNPKYKNILGERSYPDLKSVPEKIDIVDIFRRPDAIPYIVDESLKIHAKVIWMQLGLCSNASAEKARAAGLKVVMNKCIKVEHAKMLIKNDY